MKSKRLTLTPEELQSRLDAGETMASIGRSYGVTGQAVHWFVNHHKLRRGTKPSAIGNRIKATIHSTGRFTDQWGYIMVRTSSRAGALAYTPEHVLIAEQMLGRKIERGEIIHHINGNKSDNRPENLHICSRKEHMTIHRDLESLAMELVHSGHIVFEGGSYRWEQKPG